MSARAEKISINSDIKKIGIIAGSGTLPRDIYLRCQEMGMECVIVGFKNHTNYIPADFWGRISKSSQIIDFFKKNKVHDIIFIGGVTRPKWYHLRPDWFTLKFFLNAILKSLGDSSLLDAARDELEKLGFKIHGAHHFMPELIIEEGAQGETEASYQMTKDIEVGVKAAKELGHADIGQAVIVKEGVVIAREDSKGTSHMIQAHGEAGAILVKMCKPQQDRDLDLPTIGLNTVRACVDKKMLGIVAEAGASLFAEKGAAITLANKAGFFIYGYVPDATNNA